MAQNKTISVWLIVEGGEHAGKLVLQRRSEKSKNFPFVCQPMWAGKVEEGETPEDAVTRECSEELGEKFAKSFNFSGLVLAKRASYIRKGEEWEAYNYRGVVPHEQLGFAKLSEDSFPEFIFVGKDDEVFSLREGKNPKQSIVLFDDQFDVFTEIRRSN